MKGTSLTRFPMLLTCLAFALGIVMFSLFDYYIFLFLLLPALILPGYWIFVKKNHSNRIEKLFLAGLISFLILLGAITISNLSSTQRKVLDQVNGCRIMVRGEIISIPKRTRKGFKFWFRIDEISGKHIGQSENILIYTGDSSIQFSQFDLAEMNLIPNQLNIPFPGYLDYLNRKGIYHSAYTPKPKLIGKTNHWLSTLAIIRNKIKEKLLESMNDDRSGNMAVAMLLGDKSQLDPEIKKDFSVAGLSHILAISGLHVGLIYTFLLGAFGFMNRNKRMNQFRLGFIMLLLILYALITGAQPAVCRATFMFSCFLIGRIFYLKTHSINTLASAALILLIWNPESLFDPGFQLSFAAVGGILLFTKPLSNFFAERLKNCPKVFLEMAAVTIVAQICTAPFILFYFGKFPSYFLLSNLFILPLAVMAARLGFTFIFICFVPGVNMTLGFLLKILFQLISFLASLVTELPFSLIESSNDIPTGILAVIINFVLAFLIFLFLGKLSKSIKKTKIVMLTWSRIKGKFKRIENHISQLQWQISKRLNFFP